MCLKKSIALFTLLVTGNFLFAQNAKTVKNKKSQTTSVSTFINASPADVWNILTNASEYTNWNSTITSLTGEIKPKGKIELKSTLDEKRTFKLKVKEYVENEKLVWGDGKGLRTFTLTPKDGGTQFTMSETIGGFMYGMWSKYLPSFDDSFSEFARDLKIASE